MLIQNFGEVKIQASVSFRTGERSMFYKHLLFFSSYVHEAYVPLHHPELYTLYCLIVRTYMISCGRFKTVFICDCMV